MSLRPEAELSDTNTSASIRLKRGNVTACSALHSTGRGNSCAAELALFQLSVSNLRLNKSREQCVLKGRVVPFARPPVAPNSREFFRERSQNVLARFSNGTFVQSFAKNASFGEWI